MQHASSFISRSVFLTLFVLTAFAAAWRHDSAPRLGSRDPVTDTCITLQSWVGSSAFMLFNLNPFENNPPHFYQLNLGTRLSPRDAVSLEFITWQYAWPLGIPWGDDFEAEGKGYPGSIRDIGVALVYQRFLWRGAYTAVHALNALQMYTKENGASVGTGYMLFLTYRAGYHFDVGKRFFIEPSVAATHWPVRTGVPAEFRAVDDRWNNYFLFEPGLHVGYEF
jgi:hypothetical protein